jgi:hypothetical protein
MAEEQLRASSQYPEATGKKKEKRPDSHPKSHKHKLSNIIIIFILFLIKTTMVTNQKEKTSSSKVFSHNFIRTAFKFYSSL